MGKQKTYNFNFDLDGMQSIKTSKPGISKSKDNGHDPRPQNSAISKTEELSGYLAGTINNLEVNDQDSDIWDKIINTVKEPFNLAAKAGQEIGTGKYFEGALDAVTAGLHGIMLPFTVPYTGAKAEIERQGAIYQPGVEDNIGKKITSGMDKVMGLPFEVIGNYLETTKEEMAKYGVTPETLEKYMGISPELDKKITEFLTEIGGLFLLKLVHGGIKELKPKGEIPVEIKSTGPSKLGEVENAIKEGKVEQNNIPQRKEVGGGGLPTETSGSNIIKESGEIQKKIEKQKIEIDKTSIEDLPIIEEMQKANTNIAENAGIPNERIVAPKSFGEPVKERIAKSDIDPTIKEKVLESPENLDNIETQYKSLKDSWHSERDFKALKADVESSLLEDQIKTSSIKQNPKDINEAIHVYLDLKRNPQHKAQYYDKLTPEQKRIVDLAENLNPEQKRIANEIRKQYDELGKEAANNEVINNVLSNYVARTWDIPKGDIESIRKFGTKTRHAKQRVFETILEGWANGFNLKTKGATENLATVKTEIANVIEHKNLIKKGLAAKDADGNSLFSYKQLEGYKEVEHPNFTSWKWTNKVKPSEAVGDQNYFIDEKGNIFAKKKLYAPEKMAKELNNVLGTSKLTGVPGIETLTRFNAKAKAFILMSNFFHHLAFTRSYLFGGAIDLKNINPVSSYKKGLNSIKSLSPEVELLVRNGLTLGKMQDWQQTLIQSKGKLAQLLEKNKVTGKVQKNILDFQNRMAKSLFNKYGAGLKSWAAILEYRKLLDKHPELHPNARAKIVANLINDDFGGLHLGRIGRNPTLQHAFRLFALAPDWTESNVRTMVKAFKPGVEGQVYRNFWGRIASRGVGLTVLLNILSASYDKKKGETLLESYERQFKKAWDKGGLRFLEWDITPFYKAFGGEDDAYFSILGHFKDPIKFVTLPAKSAHHKGSVLFRIGYEALSGENWAGRKYTTFNELIGMDDKGKYKASSPSKGYYVGQEKGGKLTGQLTKFNMGGGEPITYEQLPSYLLAQSRSILPIQAQNLISYINGEVAGLQALSSSAGIPIRVFKQPEKKQGINIKPSKEFNFDLNFDLNLGEMK